MEDAVPETVPSQASQVVAAEAEAADRLMSLASLLEKKTQENGDYSVEYGAAAIRSHQRENGDSEQEHEPRLPGYWHGSSVQIEVPAVPVLVPVGSSAARRRVSSDDSDTDDSRSHHCDDGTGNLSASGKDSPCSRSYFVKHDYCDHAGVRLDELSPLETSIPPTQRSNRGGVKMLFPEKLHQLLSMPEDVVDPNIIAWAAHGRCFSVHNTREFTRVLMPKYFNHNAITSFQRQLNLYGFKRITKSGSKDQGAYYHELFLRGRPGLCRRMRRQKIKGTGYKPLPDPDNEPDFYSMPPCFEITDDEEKTEHEALLCGPDNPSSAEGTTTTPAKRPAPSDSVFSQEGAAKSMRMEVDGEREGTVSRRSSRVPDEINSDAGGRPAAGQRRASLPDLASSSDRFGLASHISDIAAIHSREPDELRRNSLSMQSSLRDRSGRFPDAMGFLHAGRERFPSDDASAPLGVPSRDILLQELLARARSGGEVAPLGVRNMGGDAALRSEIDMLEQTRRNIVLQQQRLQMLMDQAQAASSTRHLAQLAAAYDNASGLGGLRDLGRGLEDLERRATEIAGRAVAGRGLAGRSSIGGLEIGGERADAASGSDPNNMSVSSVFNALANMVASGRFTSAQLDEIEALLHSGRTIAAAAERKNRFDRNQWI